MEIAQDLAKRFREVFLNGDWIANTNLKETLKDISLEQATQTIGAHNSIALLSFHINYYVEGVLQVLNGGTLDIKDKFSFDMPDLTNESEWYQLKESLFKNAEQFAQGIENLTAEQMDGPFVRPAYGSYRRNIEGIIEHAYYHFGQISILKKMIPEQNI